MPHGEFGDVTFRLHATRQERGTIPLSFPSSPARLSSAWSMIDAWTMMIKGNDDDDDDDDDDVVPRTLTYHTYFNLPFIKFVNTTLLSY